MDWVRGHLIGRGSFAAVHLAIPTSASSSLISSPTAVKSAAISTSSSLKNEKHVLDCLGFCPHIVTCFGDGYSFENGAEYYNLFLEYAARGSLADYIKARGGGRLVEPDVRRYTASIVRGIRHIHARGFVHCDIKLQNVLLFENGDVKIADLGLARKTEECGKQSNGEKACEWRGTPLFMSPESVKDNVYESPADIWALGCAVVEMVTGKPAWKNNQNGSKSESNANNMCSLLLRIGLGEELPAIPEELSEEGKDFVRKCLVKDPTKRWTAEMLLKHPFIIGDDSVSSGEWTSPRSHFDFPDWVSCTPTAAASVPSSPESDEWREWKFEASSLCPARDRLRRLVTGERPDWWEWECGSWVGVR
ncbi:mitogen-activated protein kinase kinase kinase 17 [Senna tora]|uniref:Mitogen-activated protein kinase kinase kinase 17 n=1 Tax=Senna tora TaxID=362788 RepID=A0A834SVF1_9FABA|nr:mitogen-activated protein kinase kinase kinase 17 [Senna tora]